MLRRLIIHLWSMRREFAKYFVVGFSGVFLDMGTLVLFKEKFGMHPTTAVAVNAFLVLTYNFTLNKYWSFRNRAMPYKQIVRYLTLAGVNYVFSVAIMHIGAGWLHFDYRLVRLATIIMMVAWNFLLYKYWVYRVEPGVCITPKSCQDIGK